MRTAIAIAATVVCALAVGALLLAECADREDLRAKTKPLASAMFLAVAVACGAFRSGPPAWIAVGLVLGAIGDVLLMYRGDGPFLAGLIAFLGGHAAYVAAFAREVPIAAWPHASLALIVPPLVAAGIALAWLWRHLGSMRIPVIAYVVVITTMVIGALVADHAPHLATAGAILFFASDLAVARDRFVAPGFVNRAWGLPVYYAAQLLFAWSVQ